MAQRLTAGSVYLEASGNYPDANSDYTVMAWVKMASTSQSGTFPVVWELYHFTYGANNSDYVVFANFGFGLAAQAYFYTLGSGSNVTAGGLSDSTWYHFACVRSGTTCRFYKDGSLVGDFTQDNAGRAATERFELCKTDIGGFGENVDYEGLKFFNAALSAEQIAVEMLRTMPVDGSSAYLAVPFVPDITGQDLLGNCSLTLTGTIGAAEPVGVAFRAATQPRIEASSGASSQAITLTGIASAEAVGTPTVSTETPVSLTGIASAEALGSPTITTGITVALTGIGSSEALGTPTVAPGDVTVAPTGIGSSEAVGTPTVSTETPIVLTGIPTGEEVGTPTVTTETPIVLTGIGSGEGVGEPTVVSTGSLEIVLGGIDSSEAFGDLIIEGGIVAFDPPPLDIVFEVRDDPNSRDLAESEFRRYLAIVRRELRQARIALLPPTVADGTILIYIDGRWQAFPPGPDGTVLTMDSGRPQWL